ncbi:MAG: helix-turn-helix transcriptional regulator [Alphaproteobacteria bacterium]|nr:helix-turn-helix transcriptional regulator [Alphaproteobacteria bacterium]
MSDPSRYLTEFRKKNQYTQEALAQEIGVSEKTISSWETGRTQPDVESLKTLSALYGISIEELVYVSRAKRYQSFSDMITENEALLFRIAKTLLLYDDLSEMALRTAITRALKSLPDTSNVGELLPWFLTHLLCA